MHLLFYVNSSSDRNHFVMLIVNLLKSPIYTNWKLALQSTLNPQTESFVLSTTSTLKKSLYLSRSLLEELFYKNISIIEFCVTITQHCFQFFDLLTLNVMVLKNFNLIVLQKKGVGNRSFIRICSKLLCKIMQKVGEMN